MHSTIVNRVSQRHVDFVVANLNLIMPFAANAYNSKHRMEEFQAGTGKDTLYKVVFINLLSCLAFSVEALLASSRLLTGNQLLQIDFIAGIFLENVTCAVNLYAELSSRRATRLGIAAFWAFSGTVGSLKILVPQHPIQHFAVARIISVCWGTASYLTIQMLLGVPTLQIVALALPAFLAGAAVNAALTWIVIMMQRRYVRFRAADIGVPAPEPLLEAADWVVGALSQVEPWAAGFSWDLLPKGLNMTHMYMVYSIAMFFCSWGIVNDQSLVVLAVFFSSAVAVSTAMGILCETLNVRTIDERLREQEALVVKKHMAELKKGCSTVTDPAELADVTRDHMAALFPGICGSFVVLDGGAVGKRDCFYLFPHGGEDDLTRLTRTPLASSIRAVEDRCIQDSALKFGGLSFFDDWDRAEKKYGITRALATPLTAGDRTLGTLHIQWRSESRWPVDHEVVKTLGNTVAQWLLYRLATLENKAKTDLLQDLLPQHICEQLTLEAENLIREDRTSADIGTPPAPAPVVMGSAYGGPGRSGGGRAPTVSGVLASSVGGGRRDEAPLISMQELASTINDDGPASLADDRRPLSSARGLQDVDVMHLMEMHHDVTVLFCDLVGFTKLASHVSPSTTMRVLHEVISAWDDACQQLDLYKLDIIGDSFMAAGNLHRRDPEHARKMLRLASEMITLAQGVNVPGNFLSVRVGLSTGSLASGILGRVRRKFTCMGDSVNIAARMEQTGIPGAIHIHESTLKAAGIDPRQFGLEARQTEVKGKGLMTTYLCTAEQMLQILSNA